MGHPGSDVIIIVFIFSWSCRWTTQWWTDQDHTLSPVNASPPLTHVAPAFVSERFYCANVVIRCRSLPGWIASVKHVPGAALSHHCWPLSRLPRLFILSFYTSLIFLSLCLCLSAFSFHALDFWTSQPSERQVFCAWEYFRIDFTACHVGCAVLDNHAIRPTSTLTRPVTDAATS